MKNQFDLIREWAYEKGIFEKGDIKTQTLKLLEEAGELAKAIINDDEEEVLDAIGDCTVVLTNIAEFADIKYRKNKEERIKIEYCIEDVYDIISKRTGKMENGSFIKD